MRETARSGEAGSATRDGDAEEWPWLSVVVAYQDEAGSLEQLHAELSVVLDGLPFASEMLFVDDGSRDGGPAIAGGLAKVDPRLRRLSLSPRSGQSAALEAGFRVARGEIIATLDADLQNDPADLPKLLEGLAAADCVCGVRMLREDDWPRRIASRVANGVRSRVLGDGVTDIGCALRVMRKVHLDRVKLYRGGHRFLPSMLKLEGARIAERPVRHRARRHGRSKYGIARRLLVVWVDLLAMVWLSRRVDRYDVKELNRRA